MNISELRAILEKEKINPHEYDILDKNFITSWDGFIINKVDNGDFRLYYVERGAARFTASNGFRRTGLH